MTYRSLLALLLGINVANAAVDQDELDNLVTKGATDLALSLLEQSVAEDAASWLVLQKQKLDIYRYQGNWDAILNEAGNASAFELEASDIQWLKTQSAIAYIGKGEGASARDLLMSLLWAEENDKELFPQWRALVVKSYLVEGRYDDAYTAALRYDQDYPEAINAADWLNLKAVVLVFSDRSEEALRLLSEGRIEQTDPVFVLANLKSGNVVSAENIISVIKQISQGKVATEISEELYPTLLEIHDSIESASEKVLILEHLLASATTASVDIKPTADALWQAYDALAKQAANKQQLLIGNFEPWVAVAESLVDNSPIEARAINAWLAVNTDAEMAEQAHTRFGMNLDDAYGSFDLMAALYLASSKFPGGEGVPVAVRYRLLDKALTQGDTVVATAMMNSLPRPADVQGLVDWQLRRARIQVLAGTTEYGAKLLEQLTKAGYSFDAIQMNAYMQVFYDLQAQGEDQLTYMVAEAILPQAADHQEHRQLLWWMAELKSAEGDHAKAARHYLSVVDSDDRVALLKAAQELTKAGMMGDAERLYQTALEAETNTMQKTQIKRQLQRLRVAEPAAMPQ